MIKSITLLGSSSGRNAGDAALIAGIMDSIDRRLGRRVSYEIPTINPRYIRECYDNETVPVGMMPWHLSVKMLGLPTWRSIMRTDLTLIFDAILFDRSLYNPLFNFLSSLYLMLPRAKRAGKKMAYMNVGAGPVTTPAGRRMLREISELMDFIAVRDQSSYDILAGLGVRNPNMVTAADSALTCPAHDKKVDELYKAAGVDPSREILAVNVNRYLDTWAGTGRPSMGREAFVNVYREALSKVWREIRAPIVFISTQHHDVEITKAVMDSLNPEIPRGHITNTTCDHYDIKGAAGRVGLLFGMRLHAIILTSSAGAPVCGLRYQPKVEHYLRTLGMEEQVLKFDDFNPDAMAAFILKNWRERHALRERLKVVIPRQSALADATSLFVEALDQGRPAADARPAFDAVRGSISG